MKKNYLFALALLVSMFAGAQTNIDISAIDGAYTTTVDDVLVLDVAKASSPIAAALVSYDNPFKGITFTNAEISFDVNNYNGVDSIKVLGALLSIYDATLGRMYFSNGSYLGFNAGGVGFIDANLVNYAIGVDFIQGNDWKNVKLQFTTTGFAMYIDEVLAFDQSSAAVTITKGDGFVDNYAGVLTFLQNASTLAFGAGSWWSDNTRPDGTYWDAQFSYLKNIKFTPNFLGTAISENIAFGKIISVEYFNVIGSKIGTDYNRLEPGIYIKKTVYSNGTSVGAKIFKAKK